MRTIYLLVICLIAVHFSMAQTCCTAGAPVSTLFNIQNAESNSWTINAAYEYKSINLLVDENRVIENDPRSRFGQSLIAKVDYSFNKKWAVSLLLPFVHQSRQTFSSSESSLGIGDLLGILQYTAYNSKRMTISFSGGLKLPTGRTNHTDDLGIFLSPDMQNGSGSVDYVAVLGINRQNVFTPLGSLTLETYYRNNGVNSTFGSTENFPGRRFGFGDEWSTNLSYSYQVIKASGFYIPDVGLKYRWTSQNIEQQSLAPNSGGNWLSIIGGFSFMSDINSSIRLYTELPIAQQVKGLQISTNFTAGIQVRYRVDKKSKNNKI